MKLSKWHWILFCFNAVYAAVFAAYYISIQNYEFLWYVAVLIFFMGLISATLKRSKFDYVILWGLSLWGFLHMAGGGVRVDDGVLYGMEVVKLFDIGDTYVLKFDQVVHAFGFGVTTLVAFHLLRPYLNEKTNYKIVYPALVAISMGLGSLNEIIEFMAVVLFSQTGVGGYYNTALDMVFNTVGAIIALFIVRARKKRMIVQT